MRLTSAAEALGSARPVASTSPPARRGRATPGAWLPGFSFSAPHISSATARIDSRKTAGGRRLGDTNQSEDRIVWGAARAADVGRLVVRGYDIASRHLFKAHLHWEGRWRLSRAPIPLRDGGRRVDEGLEEAFEKAAAALHVAETPALLRDWGARLDRLRSALDASRRRADSECAALSRKRRELLEEASRHEWEARRAMRRLPFPVERWVQAKSQGERHRIHCVLDPREACLRFSLGEDAFSVDAFGRIEGPAAGRDVVRRLVGSTFRRSFAAHPSFFDAVTLAWRADDCDERMKEIEFDALADAGGLLACAQRLAETRHPEGMPFRATGVGISWNEVSAIDGASLHVVAHDLDRACQFNAIVDRAPDGRWRAQVVDLRPFSGDGTPIRSEDEAIAAIAESIAGRYASERQDELDRAGESARRRAELRRRSAELEAMGRAERLRESEGAIVGRVKEIMDPILRERSQTDFPASWFHAGDHVELRLEASGDDAYVDVVVDRPVELATAGRVEELWPSIRFTLEGDVEEENADWNRLNGAGSGWSLWASHMRRDAIAAVASRIVHSSVGREIEVRMLIREAKSLQEQRNALKARWGLAESIAEA